MPRTLEELTLDFPETIDSTMISTFTSCPQKFFLEYVLKKIPIAKSIHLHAGGCMAKAFENIQVMYYGQGMSEEDCFLQAFIQFTKDWGDFDAKKDSYKDFVNCWCAVEEYFRHNYPLGKDHMLPYIKEDGQPATEFRFAVPMLHNHPITGNPILYAGRADTIKVNENKLILIQDEKTTAAMGPKWADQWDLRGQFMGYTYCARLQGIPAAGALVRGIAILQTEYKFDEVPLFFTDEQLERWWQNTNKKLGQALSYYEEAVSLGRHLEADAGFGLDQHMAFPYAFGDACAAFGGCWARDLCKREDPWELYEVYDDRVWDPLAHDPTEKAENRFANMETMTLEQLMGGYVG